MQLLGREVGQVDGCECHVPAEVAEQRQHDELQYRQDVPPES
ncbi:hypothetical protein ACQEVC_10000 [Plantactinospora sp. CA-294935]